MIPLFSLFTVQDAEGNVLWQLFNRTNVADVKKGEAVLTEIGQRAIKRSRGGGKLVVSAHVGQAADFAFESNGDIRTVLTFVKGDNDYDWNDVHEMQRTIEREAEYLRQRRERGTL